MIISNNRQHHIDQTFDSDVLNAEYSNSLFIRLIAKGRRFENVDFKYTIFDTCYLRNCIFDSCDFTGCRFIGSNFYGASFNGCKFDYAVFERTIVDNDILDVGCPGYENLKLRFARTLRMNFQTLGDSKSANKAIEVELDATEAHLHKAWKSTESYYRKKYSSLKRIKVFIEWIAFKSMDLIWGNGESLLKLVRSVVIILTLMSIFDVFSFGDPIKLSSYWTSFSAAPSVFLGTSSPEHYSKSYLALVAFVRIVAIGFFISIIIKRFNRR